VKRAGASEATAGWVVASQAGDPARPPQRATPRLGARCDTCRHRGRRLAAAPLHDLRHTFASHLIVDLGLDVAQVSRILGHAQITTTLSVSTHLFDDARHAQNLKVKMAASAFVALLEPSSDRPSGAAVVSLGVAMPGRDCRRVNVRRCGGRLDCPQTTVPRHPVRERENPLTCSGFPRWS
jgi:Phage integrase family